MADTSNDQHPLPTESHQPPQQDTSEDMTILGHLTELRKRILYSLLAVAIGAAVAYNFLDEIMAFLLEPAGKLYYMQPAEAFFVYVKVTIFSGFLFALPIIFYQAWAFLLPALTMRERLLLSILVPVSVLLFVAGLLFSLLAAKFRFVILVCFVIGALLTPPDIISQCMMAIPMLMLYGVGYLVVKYILHK